MALIARIQAAFAAVANDIKTVTQRTAPATATAAGIVELATPDEVVTGTDATKAATPAGVSAAIVSNLSGKNNVAPDIVAHRAGGVVFPENSLRTIRAAVAAGFRNIEIADVWQTSDGVLVCCHDATLDRTTSGTGPVTGVTYAQFRALVNTPGIYLAPGYPNDETPPSFEEVLNEVANVDAVFLIECKQDSAETAAAIVQTLQRFGFPKHRVLLNTFSIDNALPVFLASGYPTAANLGVWSAVESYGGVSKLAADGVAQVNLSAEEWNPSRIAAVHAAGMTCQAYTVRRRVQVAALRAQGIGTVDGDMIACDEPTYNAETFAPQTRSAFTSRVYPPGVIEGGGTDGLTARGRGKFLSGGRWGFDTSVSGHSGALQGWACPIRGDENCNDFQISFTVQFDGVVESSRHLNCFFCAPNDDFFGDRQQDGPGYAFLARYSGAIQLFRKTRDELGVLLAEGNIGTIAAPLDVIIRVTPAQIVVTAGALTLTSNDTTYRGGYFYLGSNGAAGGFADVEIT
jgi:glycerophosphoryl diester phosphodiesterase